MAESASAVTPFHAHEGRERGRTHMFVAATLYSDSGSCPVHIRNMSLTGALIEGSVLPEIGAALTLRRGGLEAKARVVWKANRKAGVAFTAAIDVADWMSRTPPAHQARVDEIVRSLCSGATGATGATPAPTSGADPSIAAELSALKADLEELEAGLIGDAILVATHPEIQLLDIAVQRIGRMLAGIARS